MAAPGLNELHTFVSESRRGKTADNILNSNALLTNIKMVQGGVDEYDGGDEILEEIMYDDSELYTRYSGGQTLPVPEMNAITAARYTVKQAAVPVVFTGREKYMVRGKAESLNLVKTRHKAGEKIFMNGHTTDLYSDGTADGGAQIGGLQLIISTSPTSGKVGSIDKSLWPFWRNHAPAAESITKSNINEKWTAAWVAVCRGQDKPTMILTDNGNYQKYIASLQDRQRFTDAKMAKEGFDNIKFISAPVILDGGIGGNIPTNYTYFVNANYLHYRPHKNRNMVTDEPRKAFNQDADVSFIFWMGALTCSGLRYQAVVRSS